MRHFLVLPALRFGEQDQPLLDAAVNLVGRLRPARVFLTGLFADTVSVGASAEFPSLSCPSDEVPERLGVAVLRPLRRVYQGNIGAVGFERVHGGPWDSAGEQLLPMLDEAGVEALTGRYEFAPDWLILGRCWQACRPVDSAAGATALAIAQPVGSSVIVGDTGRVGVGRLRVVGEDGQARTLVGAEAGSMVHGRSVGDVVDRRKRSETGALVVRVEEGGQVAVQCVSL